MFPVPSLLRLIVGLAISSSFATTRACPAQDSTSTIPDITQQMLRVREALVACDWPYLFTRCESVRSSVPRGSDAWLEASAWQAKAAWERGDLSRCESTARELLTVVDELLVPRAGTEVRRLHSILQVPVLTARHHLSGVLQARGEHAGALELLHPTLRAIEKLSDPAAGTLLSTVGVDAAKSLLALGQVEDADTLLHSIHANFPDAVDGVVALVIRQAHGRRPDAYRGKFAGDSAHAERMRSVWESIPSARKKLAALLGIPEDQIARPWIGVGDLASACPGLAAVTNGEARIPALESVVVVSSEALALDILDVETTLVHELAHATLVQRLGIRHEQFPHWLEEGLVQALTGEIDLLPERFLALRSFEDPVALLDAERWRSRPLAFDSDGPCSSSGPDEAPLAILELRAAGEGTGVRRFLEGVFAGKEWEPALRAATGFSTEEYLERARSRARSLLDERIEASRAWLGRLRGVSQLGGDAAIGIAEAALREPVPHLVRCEALRLCARTFEANGRALEALFAWDALAAESRAFPGDTELAHWGAARAVLALGRREEARARLTYLARAGLGVAAPTWARAQLERLGGGR